MREKFKWFVSGVLATIIVLGLSVTTTATTGQKQALLDYLDIKITLDGNTLTPKDAGGNVVEPFAINGTTYLPLRAISSALGLGVDWDQDTHTVKLTNGNSQQAQSSGSTRTDLSKVELTERGGSYYSNGYYHYGFIIENPSKDTAYEFPKVVVTAYDKGGAVLATDTQTMMGIQPGEKQAFSSIMGCNGESPAKITFGVESGNVTAADSSAIKSSDLVISGVRERKDDFGTVITGAVKNISNKSTSDVAVTVLFKKDGKIVDGETTFVDNLAAGGEKAFEIQIFRSPAHDSFEVSAIDWGL